ncbi:MAG TPA: beta-galactosidase [Candidatus Baltobacteraceae bacterium]|nr:beta-galactosidase [Candidatus Baltobacteraceae bacterium]
MHLWLAAVLAWNSWHTSAIVQDHGYPVFTVDGKPFFVYGAAFFYERIPRERWDATLDAYRKMGVNTIDLYVIWNWHQPSASVLPDFSGATDPRRNLLALLGLIHKRGFKVILRPGPVIRNEWRNGGYPDWLLKRPEYHMPLHDILEGRYPATATLQNAHADAAAAEWLNNSTHLRYATQWLNDVLKAVAPYGRDVIAIALDDDQGAYIDNDTYPAPHWHEYIFLLRLAVASVAGPRVPLFLNTFEMKVPAVAPAWSWGNWYQSDAYSIGAHDLAELDFATGLLQTQPHVPLMQAEFQAGWLQGADEGKPRPADPANTTLALNELLRDGMHGIVNFPVQDTVYPPGWEVPWANWDYFWDAALTNDLQRSPRYVPTAEFGTAIRRYGSLLARTHPAFDAAIVWPPSLYQPESLTNADFAAFRDATLAMQRDCRSRRLNCALVDLSNSDDAWLRQFPKFVLPIVPGGASLMRLRSQAVQIIQSLQRSHRLIPDLSGIRPTLDASSSTLLVADDSSFAFIDTVNASDSSRQSGPIRVRLAQRTVAVSGFTVPARSARVVLVGRRPLHFETRGEVTMNAAPVPPLPAFAAAAGARIRELSGGPMPHTNVATSIGLLRDAVDPEPPPSARDYIAAYTHPIPAGTFNRTYDCGETALSATTAAHCIYDAPDIPNGGALFERTIRNGANGDLVVTEHFAPHDPASTARLKSISGFAFADGDAIVNPQDGNGVGILDRKRLAMLRWAPGDVTSVDVRQTRGAAVVTLVCARRDVEFHLAVVEAASRAEAEALLRANPRQSP